VCDFFPLLTTKSLKGKDIIYIAHVHSLMVYIREFKQRLNRMEMMIIWVISEFSLGDKKSTEELRTLDIQYVSDMVQRLG